MPKKRNDVAWIEKLELANYAATADTARVTPGLDLVVRHDVVMTASDVLPLPDANHACLLRTPAAHLDSLVEEIVEIYRARHVAPTVYLSPACRPQNLERDLSVRGFRRIPGEEAWLTLTLTPSRVLPKVRTGTEVCAISAGEAEDFAKVFLTAFGMPEDFSPALASLLSPSIGLPNTYHYMAVADGAFIGTCSLLVHSEFAILGSAGVIPSRRRTGAAMNLAIAAIAEARDQGAETVLLQTAAGTPLERLLRISGFTRAFTRVGYTLDHEAAD